MSQEHCLTTVLTLSNVDPDQTWQKDTVEPRYLELAYFELPLISK